MDGPIGDNLIVVIRQRPLAPPVSGALLPTKPRERRWDQRAGEQSNPQGKEEELS